MKGNHGVVASSRGNDILRGKTLHVPCM